MDIGQKWDLPFLCLELFERNNSKRRKKTLHCHHHDVTKIISNTKKYGCVKLFRGNFFSWFLLAPLQLEESFILLGFHQILESFPLFLDHPSFKKIVWVRGPHSKGRRKASFSLRSLNNCITDLWVFTVVLKQEISFRRAKLERSLEASPMWYENTDLRWVRKKRIRRKWRRQAIVVFWDLTCSCLSNLGGWAQFQFEGEKWLCKQGNSNGAMGLERLLFRFLDKTESEDGKNGLTFWTGDF